MNFNYSDFLLICFEYLEKLLQIVLKILLSTKIMNEITVSLTKSIDTKSNLTHEILSVALLCDEWRTLSSRQLFWWHGSISEYTWCGFSIFHTPTNNLLVIDTNMNKQSIPKKWFKTRLKLHKKFWIRLIMFEHKPKFIIIVCTR